MASFDSEGSVAAARPPGWRGFVARQLAPMRGCITPTLIADAIVLGAWIIGVQIKEGIQTLKDVRTDIHSGTHIIHHADFVFNTVVRELVVVVKAFKDTT
jgi:hypothetical protein